MHRRWLSSVAALGLIGAAQGTWADAAGPKSAAAKNKGVAFEAGAAVADDGSNVIFGKKNRAAASDNGGAAVAGSGLAVGASNNTVSGDGATAVFGQGNLAAAPHVHQVLPGWTAAAGGTIDTGSVHDQSIGEVKGSYFVAGNTGVGNQAAPLAVAAKMSFN